MTMASSTIVGLNAVLQLDSRGTNYQSWGNKTVQNATEQRNIIAASLRKGKTWIIHSVRKPTPPFYHQRAEMVRSERVTQWNTSKRILKKKTWFWLKIQSTWKSYDIRQQAYNNVIVHILYSMCSAQVHMVTQHWENTRHHVVQVEKWEHLQF